MTHVWTEPETSVSKALDENLLSFLQGVKLVLGIRLWGWTTLNLTSEILGDCTTERAIGCSNSAMLAGEISWGPSIYRGLSALDASLCGNGFKPIWRTGGLNWYLLL